MIDSNIEYIEKCIKKDTLTFQERIEIEEILRAERKDNEGTAKEK